MRNLVPLISLIFCLNCFADSETFQGKGNDRLAACKDAKDSARTHFRYTPSLNQAIGSDIKISECDCDEDDSSSVNNWTCNVDADWDKSSDTAVNESNEAAEEVETAEGRGGNETEACSGAKYFVQRKIPSDAKIRRYSDCSCSALEGSVFDYVCSVEVYYERR